MKLLWGRLNVQWKGREWLEDSRQGGPKGLRKAEESWEGGSECCKEEMYDQEIFVPWPSSPPSKASEQEIDWFSWYWVRKVPTPSFVYWPSVMGSCPSILGIVLGGRRRWWRFVSCRHHLCLVRARHCRLLLRREQDLYSIRHYNHSCCHYLASIVGLRAYHLYTHTSQTVVAISAPLTDV